MDGVIAFAKGRALERIRAYDLAADAYLISGERELELRAEALRSADLCENIYEALQAGAGPEYESFEIEREVTILPSPESILRGFETRAALFESVTREAEGTHHIAVVREEIERNDAERARYFVALRGVIPNGDVRAVAELQQVVMRHPESKFNARHLLDLADLYTDLSIEYAERNPPESLTFDPAEFRELVDSGARLYEMVAARDGTTEKLEASRRLEAFLAFAISIDRDRFTP
jgi:hypothetical protein